jgi:hypothetical protein
LKEIAMPTNFDGAATLGGAASSTGGLRKIDRQPAAKMSANGALDPLPLFTLLASVLDEEADVTLRRAAM